MNVIAELVAGRARLEWYPIVSKHEDLELTLAVPKDALRFGGVRRSATAWELQEAADLLGAMLMTPKVVDLMWQQATTRIDSIVRCDGVIAADSTDERVTATVDAALGSSPVGLLDSVGKYWVVTNQLLRQGLMYGKRTACNYGWCGAGAPHLGVTLRNKVWQTPGFRHDYKHKDPSQVMRVMHRTALLRQGGASATVIDLHEVASSPTLAPLISHEGILRCLRQPSVPAPSGSVVLPHYPLNIANLQPTLV